MTRLHRQVSWTDAASYATDLYASLAAVTLPPKGGTIAFGTVATREPSRQSALPSRPFRRVSTIACLAIAAWCIVYFAAQMLRAVLS